MTKQKITKTASKATTKRPVSKKVANKTAARHKINKSTKTTSTRKFKSKKIDDDPYDGLFALKLALYVVAGSLWLKISKNGELIPIPIGLAAGMILATREKFRTDRKIDYAVLLIAALVGFFAPFGFYITL